MTHADLFRQLRESWFNARLRSQAQERVWESEGCELLRDEKNKENKAVYDRQTEALLEGDERFMVNPSCAYDLSSREVRA